MIDEHELTELLRRAADEIPVPPEGADHVVDQLVHSSAVPRRDRVRFTKPLLVAAAIVGVIAISIPVLHTSGTTHASSKAVSAPAQFGPNNSEAAPGSVVGGSGVGSGGGAAYGVPDIHGASGATGRSLGSATPTTVASAAPPSASTGSVDGAKIVKTGTLDLLVPHATLRTAVNRVTGVAVGLAGYVSASKTSYDDTDPTAQITVRVPVANFDTAIARLDTLPGVKVLGDSESGVDVTGHYTDLQAQLAAATTARDDFVSILSHAQSIADILTVRDRVTAAQTEVDQLQGQIKLLDDQATFSALAITLAEKAATVPPVAHHTHVQSGLAKSWSDARHGFATGVEWLIARSGAALIILLAGLALLFGIRYLYPVVRRGLV